MLMILYIKIDKNRVMLTSFLSALIKKLRIEISDKFKVKKVNF